MIVGSRCWNTFVSCFKLLLKSSNLCDHKQRSLIATDASACLLSSWFSCRERLRTQKALGLLSDSKINPNFLPLFFLFIVFRLFSRAEIKIYVVVIHNKYTQLSLQSTVTTMNPHCSWTEVTSPGKTHTRGCSVAQSLCKATQSGCVCAKHDVGTAFSHTAQEWWVHR